MRALVTGAAGFIGSHLVDRLIAEGWTVRGVDNFTPYYSRATKERNLFGARQLSEFSLLELDLATADLGPVLEDVEVVFHVAGQPGVRGSWNTGFSDYLTGNVLVTQRLLEAARAAGLKRFVYSSSSSVYGETDHLPVREADPTLPHSPYGVTKLAGERLCSLYAANWGLPTVSLRYFTVYGPRQRPDMAIHRLIQCGLTGEEFTKYGSGQQRRDFTFVDDVVSANLAAAAGELEAGSVLNVGGGSTTSLNGLIDELNELLPRRIEVREDGNQPGDVKHTSASIDLAQERLGWTPRVPRPEGLRRQVEWHLEAFSDRPRTTRETRPLRPTRRRAS